MGYKVNRKRMRLTAAGVSVLNQFVSDLTLGEIYSKILKQR